MESKEITEKKAIDNYSISSAWPLNDKWHSETYSMLYKLVTKTLKKNATKQMVILNAGSGGTVYGDYPNMIHLDIVEKNIKSFAKHIISSITSIPLEDESVDIIICVGSVLNYTDAQKSICEFSRVLKPNGFLLLEFERSTSAEFLFTKDYNKELFLKNYHYNNQENSLWMYKEKNIIKQLKLYRFAIKSKKRFHVVSTLFYRFGMSEGKAAKFIKADKILWWCSYWLAHNCFLFAKKI